MSASYPHFAIARGPSLKLHPFEWVRRSIELARQRRALARLSSDQLVDIGLSPREAEEEARRAFWDAPENWRS